ncbi:superkiller complex protein 3 [Osmia lignaria lignaria]|uniref:superkiller complex protein 3 n=1 Tax=Osmia lignaria lignaria TaxID=1437193 RepID=UPI001478AE46|nr:tetratricopeptide repeat protein 37 [Osmia lignaria]
MSDEVKAAYKEAREAYKQKKFADVIKKCKKILKKDKNHYGTLVLLAVAMNEIEEHKSQIPLILQKAIQIQADNPLAWQGLVIYYETNLHDDESYNKLILAYCKLLKLDSGSKFSTTLNKLLDISLQVKDSDVLVECIESLFKLQKELDDDKIMLINKTLAWILINNYNGLMTPEYQGAFEGIFVSVINDDSVSDRQDYYRKYLKILYNRSELMVLIKQAINVHQKFPQDILPLEYICQVYYEQNILYENHIDIDITQFYESLLKLNVNSESAAVAKAVYLKEHDNLVGAREILTDVLVLKPNSVYGWVTLSEINAKLYCWEDAESAARQALKIKECKQNDELLHKIELILAESMSRSNSKQKWESTLQIYEKNLKKYASAKLELVCARIAILLDDPDVHIKLNNLESKFETKVQANILRAFYLKRHKQFEEAVNSLDSALETSEAWLLLGTIYWEMAEYNYSLMAFLNGIKTDRYNWECLVYLGHYYREHGNDIERSRRCYQTALQINPNSEEAGIGLSTAYRLLKNQDANIQLLQKLTVRDSGPKWAWLQLGLQYLDQGDAAQAIKAFQHVIRADPYDNHCWESLADAYFVRGAYTSALKSYQRALELCPKSLYPIIQLANIKLIIKQYNEAKIDFENLLLNEPNYIPALKGLGETCLALAKEYIAKQLLGRAKNHLQLAMDCLTTAIKERKNTSCIWKLLGDVCYRVATMPEKYGHLQVSSILIKRDDTEDIVMLKRRDLFLLSSRCYCSALSLSPHSSLLWYDLALCYLMQLQLDPSVDHTKLAGKCLAAAKHAVKLCPSMWLHWNLLGVICMSPYIKNYALAQHAFIMAIDKGLNSAIVCCNLGTLYLHIGNLYKGNEAYSQAQRLDPAYINSWVGQAIIAEKLSRKEAIDLFRHCTQLGYHDQAAVGYTHSVLTMILNPDIEKNHFHTYIIEKMHAVFVATDVVTWYVERHPNDCYARNAYGLLLERQKLYKSAAEQFAAAVCVCTNEEKDSVCINLARVLLQLAKYDEAVKFCQAVKETTYNSQCYLALSLFKAAKYEESYNTYETTLNLYANTDTQKAYTLCAMAAIAYTFQRVQDAKILLFQCIQIQPPIIMGLLAAAALGILHGDVNLTTLVLNELKIYKNHSVHGHHVTNLLAYFYIIGNNIKSAIATLSKAIFTYPGDVRYWKELLRILLETDLKSFSRCAQKTLFLSRNTATENVTHIACASFYSYCIQNSLPSSKRLLQKLLFTYPSDIESWATFIAACLSRSPNMNLGIDAQRIDALISVTIQNYQPKDLMAKWLYESKEKIKQIVQIKETS